MFTSPGDSVESLFCQMMSGQGCILRRTRHCCRNFHLQAKDLQYREVRSTIVRRTPQRALWNPLLSATIESWHKILPLGLATCDVRLVFSGDPDVNIEVTNLTSPCVAWKTILWAEIFFEDLNIWMFLIQRKNGVAEARSFVVIIFVDLDGRITF